MSHYCINYRADASQFRDYIIIWLIISDVTLLGTCLYYLPTANKILLYVRYVGIKFKFIMIRAGAWPYWP